MEATRSRPPSYRANVLEPEPISAGVPSLTAVAQLEKLRPAVRPAQPEGVAMSAAQVCVVPPISPMLACLHAPLTVEDRNLAHRQQNNKQSRDFATMGLGYMLRHSKRAWRTGERGRSMAYAAGVLALSPLAPLVPIGVVTLVEDGSAYASSDKAVSVRRRKVLAYLHGLGKQLKSLQPMSRTEVRLVDGRFEEITYAVPRATPPERVFDTVAAVRRDLAELAADPDQEAVEVRAYTSIRKKVRALEKACVQLEAELS